MLSKQSNGNSESFSNPLSLPSTGPAKDCLDRSNEDVKIKIDFVTASSLQENEWVHVRLSCHYSLYSPWETQQEEMQLISSQLIHKSLCKSANMLSFF